MALANAAAGPSSAISPSASTTPSTSAPAHAAAAPSTAIPTGVPAGSAGHGGSPVLPLVLLLLGLTVAGGGALSYRIRGKFTR